MKNTILNFNKQFEFNPEIKNGDNLKKYEKFIVAGMGGSHLAADLLSGVCNDCEIRVHNNYRLPFISESDHDKTLIILSSYSGNTEEVLSACREARKRGLDLAAITIGGKLLEIAKKIDMPYIVMPDTGIQPRSALGFSLKSLIKMMGKEDLLEEAVKLVDFLNPSDYEDRGQSLAKALKGRVPVIYSSSRNEGVAYNWKIKFNENSKIPAFYNVFPELNHNEMTGFDVQEITKELSEKFYFILLKDKDDSKKNIKRMELLESLYRERGFDVEVIEMDGESDLHKIFSSLVIADWTSYYLAEGYGINPEEIPMVEEFKKLVRE